MMNFLGISGNIVCPRDQAISIQSIVSASSVVLSGSLGTYFNTGGASPITDANYKFATNEEVTIAGAQSVALNYIFYRDQTSYMTQDPGRAFNKRITPGKWDVS